MSERWTSTPLVRIENLHVAFPSATGWRTVVEGFNLTLQRGETVALVGESGSGKSVSARCLIALNGPLARVSFDRFELEGKGVAGYRERQWRHLRGQRIGFVLQDALASLDPLRRIGQQLADVFSAHRRLDRVTLRQRSCALLEAVGIPDPERRLSHYPHQLSGGLRQRALIATAIAAHPPLVIADEPTTALDMTVQRQILELLRERQRLGDALLLISHDLAVVAQLADRVLVMRNGKIVEQGPTDQLLRAPRHPYTRQLLAAIPSRASRGRRLAPHLVGGGAERRLPAKRIDPQQIALEAKGLVKRYAGDATPAVDGVSFTLRRGETLGIVGESGSGKSSVARLVLALIAPDAGEVRIDGVRWSDLEEAKRRPRRADVQLISQDPLSSFDPRFTVERIVGESLDARGVYGAERRRRVVELLDAVRLDAGYLHRYPRELSGGQRQRIAIARAFAPRPRLLIADEPVSALDVSVQAQVLDLLAELQAEFGTALLFISHDLGVVHHLADRVVVMQRGRVVESGEVDSVFTAPVHPYTCQLLEALPSLPAREQPPKAPADGQTRLQA